MTLTWLFKHLEDSLLPISGSWVKKTLVYSYKFLKFSAIMPLATAGFLLSLIKKHPTPCHHKDSPLTSFAKSPKWDKNLMKAAPVDIGFATSEFQDMGPKHHLKTNWGEFHEKNHEKLGDLGETTNFMDDPQKLVTLLKEIGCNKFRFSVSRNRIEPVIGGSINKEGLDYYRHFCRFLISHGIEPMVTLHHFSDPLNFSWEKSEDIDGLVRYAELISDVLYEEGVRKIVTVNEPTVLAFQGWIMGEFPPHRVVDFKGAGKVLENIVKAHTRIYDSLKAKHPDFEIGLSHDPIRFRHFHKKHLLWTPIEKIICYYLTELNHGALLRFLETGSFCLKVPFFTNYSFELRRKPPLDFIGLQYYSDPLIKLSFTGASSVTRVPGEKLATYQYRLYPQGLASALEELQTLNVPIEITEIGMDIGVNIDEESDHERIQYFDRIFQVIQKSLDHGVNVRSVYFWTLVDNLEWYKAWEVRFGFYRFDQKTNKITSRAASLWIEEKIKERNLIKETSTTKEREPEFSIR